MEGELDVVLRQPGLDELVADLVVDLGIVDGAVEFDAVEVDGLGRVARELLQPLAVLLAARVVVIGEQANAVVALAALQRRGNGANLTSKLAFSATVIGVANPGD